MKILTVSLCGFMAVFLAVWGLWLFATRKKRNLQVRLEQLAHAQGDNSDRDSVPLEETSQPRNFKGVSAQITRLLVKKEMTKQLEARLAKGDIPLRGEEFLLCWLLCALVPVTLVYLMTQNFIMVFLTYILGVVTPPYLVRVAQKKKLKKFNLQIGDTLGIISNALRAGFSFLQTMDMVGKEMPAPIGKEFARTFREISLGTTTEEALQNLAKRVDSDDLDLLVTAVLIQRQVGGNLAEILDSISQTIRERIRIQGEIKTLTAQGRISGVIIGLIPPGLIVLILVINPGYMMPLFQSPVGLIMLGGCIVNEIIGMLLIRKIISIDA